MIESTNIIFSWYQRGWNGEMLTIQLDQTGQNGYIYHQIYMKIKEEILNRNLQPHDQLPSKRELAETLNVSVNSVNGAYQQLLAEGYLYSVERKGFSWNH